MDNGTLALSEQIVCLENMPEPAPEFATPSSMTVEIAALAAPETSILVTRVEAAAILRVSPKTLVNWASTNTGPRSRKSGRTAVYLRSEIESYIADLFEQEAA